MARQSSDVDRPKASDTDGDHDAEHREKARGSKPLKAKDLSHVPCKFHRQGACTAGASCPFSHVAAEPGQQKGICQWYLKGNCKFGHKCALAHVLPGQPMSMDRKNKRAEQQAAQSKTASASSNGNHERKRSGANEKQHDDSREGDSGGSATLGPVPRGSVSSSRPPMMIGKATATVSTTSQLDSPLRDADLSRPDDRVRRSSLAPSSFSASTTSGIPRTSNLTQQLENSGLALVTSISPPNNVHEEPHSPVPLRHSSATVASLENNVNASPERKRSPIPKSQSRPNPRAITSDLGFGPIGSPPQPSTLPVRLNHPGSPQNQAYSSPGGISITREQRGNSFSPAASPANNNAFNFDPSAPGGFGASPFSPGSASLYMPFGQGGSVPSRTIAPLTAAEHNSGTGLGVWGETTHRGSLPASALLGTMSANDVAASSQVIVDEDAEELLPQSLHDLLSEDERMHRENRSYATERSKFNDLQPRFASSVPATGLLGQLHSGGLWNGKSLQRTNDTLSQYLNGRQGPSTSRNNDISGSFGAGNVPSPSLLGTSNASAAFLSTHLQRTNGGAHDIYPYELNAGLSDARDTLPHPSAEFTISPPRTMMLSNAKSSGMYLPNDPSYVSSHQTRPLDGGVSHDQMALSPSSRALRSHEPGQSLPQGLAAGLSRLHLVPAANLVSPPPPSGSMTGSPREGFSHQQDDWFKSISTELRSLSGGTGASAGSAGILSPPRVTALHNTFGGQGAGGSNGVGHLNGGREVTLGYTGAPATLALPSTQHPWATHNPSSPLSRTVPGHEDTMFEMDDA